MGILRLASDETKRIDLGDEDYLDVRTDISKRDFNKILRALPEQFDADKGFTVVEADEFTVPLFDMLVVGWSLPVEPTVDNYKSLARESATEVDRILVEHFNSLSPTKEETTKSKRPSK